MGMSIDKAIPKIQFVRNALNDDMEIAKAYDLAIDTMRKYQKIVPALSDYDLIKPIAEVKDIDYEGTYIKLSDLQDYIYEVENGRTKQKRSN